MSTKIKALHLPAISIRQRAHAYTHTLHISPNKLAMKNPPPPTVSSDGTLFTPAPNFLEGSHDQLTKFTNFCNQPPPQKKLI